MSPSTDSTGKTAAPLAPPSIAQYVENHGVLGEERLLETALALVDCLCREGEAKGRFVRVLPEAVALLPGGEVDVLGPLPPAAHWQDELFSLGALLYAAGLGHPLRLAYLLDGYPPPETLDEGLDNPLGARTEALLVALTSPERRTPFLDRQHLRRAIERCLLALDDDLLPEERQASFRGGPERNPLIRTGHGPRDVEVVWRYRLGGRITASPILSRYTVYAASLGGAVEAVDREEGRRVWRYEGKPPIDATPLARGDRLYVCDDGGRVTALDRASGGRLWRHQVSSARLRSSPLALRRGEGADLICLGTGDGRLVAVEGLFGEPRWEVTCGGACFAAPTAVPRADGGIDVAIGSDAPAVHLVDGATGERRWVVRMPDRVRATAPTFALGDRRALLVGCFDGTLVALDGATGEPLWRLSLGERIYSSPLWDEERGGGWCVTTEGRLVHVDEAGRIRAERELGQVIASSPLVVGDALLIGSEEGDLLIFDAASLDLRRRRHLGGPIRASIAADPDEQGAAAFVAAGVELLMLRLLP